MSHELEIGEELDGRFRIEDLLSEGGMARVYRARDMRAGAPVAVKVPLMRFESDPVFYRQFQRESEILGKLHHPSILRLINVDPEARSRPYMVTELLEGQSLEFLLAQEHPMDIPRAVTLVCRLCEALSYIHEQGIVHRDLKPGNVMLCTDGTLRVLDFGLAMTPRQTRLVSSNVEGSVGTAVYMAPEQVRGKRGDARVDVYALGSILYELTTGTRPYPMEDFEEAAFARLSGDPVAPRTLNPAISPELEEIILRAVARDPNQRYATCAALRKDLENQNAVHVSGLSTRLETPKPYRPLRGLALRWAILSAIPLVAFALMYVLTRRH